MIDTYMLLYGKGAAMRMNTSFALICKAKKRRDDKILARKWESFNEMFIQKCYPVEEKKVTKPDKDFELRQEILQRRRLEKLNDQLNKENIRLLEENRRLLDAVFLPW